VLDADLWGKMSKQSEVPLNVANRFAHIDALRAFAVLIVVFAHAGLGRVIPGGSGVTIFFSVSGFIITYLVLREKEKTGSFSAKGFYVRRFVKIAPPLVLLVVLPTLIFSIWHKIDFGAFMAQIFFIFNWFKIDNIPAVLPGSGVVWSLAIEEQFYIAFALFWLVAVRARNARTMLSICAALVVIWSMSMRFVFASTEVSADRIYYGSDTRIDGIAWGVLTAVAFHYWSTSGGKTTKSSRAFGSDWTLWAAIALYVVSLTIRDEWFRDTIRFSFQSLATCAVILYGQLPGSGPIRRYFVKLATWRPVAIIGLASYSIYLAHLSFSSAVSPLVIGLPPIIVFALQVAGGVTIGILVYYFVEKPSHSLRLKLLDARKRKLYRRTDDDSATGGAPAHSSGLDGENAQAIHRERADT
jgi:peptidoglycan/LPS O-acetylase OafA/YrhL